MTTKEIIERYGLKDAGNGQLKVTEYELMKKENAVDEIKSRKAEILEFLVKSSEEEKAAAEDKKRRISEIEGLVEIKKAKAEIAKWRDDFNKRFEGEYAVGGEGVGKRPEQDINAMLESHPRAAAYLKAESKSNSDNYEIAAIGTKALNEVIYGDYAKAMTEMDAELTALANKHLWD